MMVPSSTTADRRPTVQSRGSELSNVEAYGQKFVWDSSKDLRTGHNFDPTPTSIRRPGVSYLEGQLSPTRTNWPMMKKYSES